MSIIPQPHRFSLALYRATERRRTTSPELRLKLRRLSNVLAYIEEAPFPCTAEEMKALFGSVQEIHHRLRHGVECAYEATGDERLKPFVEELAGHFACELRWENVYKTSASATAWSLGEMVKQLLELAEEAPIAAEWLRALITIKPYGGRWPGQICVY